MEVAAILVFLLGLSIGSFLNVLVLRHKERSLSGRSECPRCRTRLSWYELIPLFSFLFQKGKCRSCEASVSLQYPLVELSTGLLFVAIFFKKTEMFAVSRLNDLLAPDLFISLVVVFAIASTLIAIFVYDLYNKIIPNSFVFSFIALSAVYLLYDTLGRVVTPELFLDIGSGFIFFFIFWSLWYFSGGTWMGFGDAKLVLGIGLFLGFIGGISALILGFWIGAGVALVLMAASRLSRHSSIEGDSFYAIGLKSEIPFGPFLILGVMIAYFFELDVLNVSYLLL